MEWITVNVNVISKRPRYSIRENNRRKMSLGKGGCLCWGMEGEVKGLCSSSSSFI